MKICVYCVNNNEPVCIEKCQPEAMYRHLEPELLVEWESPPELPSFREFVEWRPWERAAVLYLDAWYRRPREAI